MVCKIFPELVIRAIVPPAGAAVLVEGTESFPAMEKSLGG